MLGNFKPEMDFYLNASARPFSRSEISWFFILILSRKFMSLQLTGCNNILLPTLFVAVDYTEQHSSDRISCSNIVQYC